VSSTGFLGQGPHREVCRMRYSNAFSRSLYAHLLKHRHEYRLDHGPRADLPVGFRKPLKLLANGQPGGRYNSWSL